MRHVVAPIALWPTCSKPAVAICRSGTLATWVRIHGMFASTSSSLATRTNLRRLLRLRLVMTVVLGAAAAIAMLYYDVALPMHTVVGAMLLMLMLMLLKLKQKHGG